MEMNIQKLLDTTVYLVAVFDGGNKLIFSNSTFKQFFRGVEAADDIIKNFKLSKRLIWEEDIENGGKYRTIVKSDENEDHIFKFEVSSSGEYKLAIGIKLDYEDIIRLAEDMLTKNYVKIDGLSDISIAANNKNSGLDENFYVTIMLSDDLDIKMTSGNIGEYFAGSSYIGMPLEQAFGPEFAFVVSEKIKMLDAFKYISFDLMGKLVAVSPHDDKGYVLNIYPYSKDVHDKFAEIQSLKATIKRLEMELNNKNKLIKVQKMIFENIKTIDDMTKLYNRAHFYRTIEGEIRRAKKLEYPLSLIIFSLENLKEINLTAGTEYGDEALRELANTIKSLLKRDFEMAFRLSSHEFAVISLNTSPQEAFVRFREAQDVTLDEMKLDVEFRIIQIDLAMDAESITAYINENTHSM